MLELIRRIGAEFGIAVIVTSHLLGELERVCESIVVIDGGRLLRHSSTASVTAARPVVTVEGDRDLAELSAWPGRAGGPVRSEGWRLHVDVGDGAAYVLVRDGVAELALGLVRMERGRHRMTEIFPGASAEAGVRGCRTADLARPRGCRGDPRHRLPALRRPPARGRLHP